MKLVLIKLGAQIIIFDVNRATAFAIFNEKNYGLVATLLTQHNAKLLQQL